MSYCLITGGSGFIARACARFLKDRGFSVLLASRNPEVNNVYYNPSDLSVLEDLFDQYEISNVVHLAGRKDRTSTDAALTHELLSVNLMDTLKLVDVCTRKARLKRFVFLGTCDEYGQQSVPFNETLRENPVSAYGASKLAATRNLQMLWHSIGFPAVIARPSLVYGPGQYGDMFIPALLRTLADGKVFQMSQGTQERDFIYIDDLLHGIEALLTQMDIEGEIFNLASGTSVNLNEIVDIVLPLVEGQETGSAQVQRGDLGRKNDANTYRVSVEKTKNTLDWHSSTPLHVGLKNTLMWIQSQ